MSSKIENDHLTGIILPEIKVIHNLEDLSRYKEVWNRILADNLNTNPFLEYDWIETWWNYFGRGHNLFVIILHLKERVVGICPFMISKRRLYQEITFMGYPEACFMDFILTEEGRTHGIEAAMEYIRNLHGNYILHLYGLIEESYAFKTLEAYFIDNNYKYHIRNFEAPYFRIIHDFVTYFKSRSKYNSIKTLIRSKNKLEEAGSVTYKQLNSSEIDESFHLHEIRWKKKYDTSNFSEKKHREFFRAIANNENQSFQVYVYGMKLGKRLIAFTYGFLCNGTYYLYRICHDNDFSVYGPGKIILMKLIENCFQKELQVFDFGLGYARYKSEWADDKNIIHDFFVPLNSVSRIFLYMYTIRSMVIERAKQFKFYNTMKIDVLGSLQYFITFNFIRDLICFFRNIKSIEVFNKTRDILIKLVRNLYLTKEYIVVEKVFSHIGQDDTIYDNSFVSVGWETNQDPLEDLTDIVDYKIHESYLNDLEYLCEIMKEQPAQIIQRFYHKQRCFILDFGIKGKECLWVNSNQIEISDINYREDITENKIYFDLSKVDIIENSMLNIIPAIDCIMNTLHLEKCTKYYIGFKTIKVSASLKNRMNDIGYKPYKHFKYKNFLYHNYLKTY